MAIILVFEDKLGITDGYKPIWDSMLFRAGMNPDTFRRLSIHKSPAFRDKRILVRKGNRIAPGFNNEDEGLARMVRSWFSQSVFQVNPKGIVIMDPALLGIFDSNWDNATIDNMRGGVYEYQGRKVLIMAPISSINTKKSLKDIRILNDGAESKSEWEEAEHDPDELWVEPYTLKAGRWIMQRDIAKMQRVMGL